MFEAIFYQPQRWKRLTLNPFGPEPVILTYYQVSLAHQSCVTVPVPHVTVCDTK